MAVGAMAHQQQQENEDPTVLERSLSRAIKLRAPYIKEQSDQLTLSSVRRLLERDLGLKNLYLEEHKAVIKGLVDKVLNEGENDAEDEDSVSEKANKRRRKNSRVVEDLQDVELETRSTVDGNDNKKKRRVLKKVGDADKKNPTASSLDDSEDQVNLTTDKDGEIHVHAEMSNVQGRSNVVEESAVPGDDVLSEMRGAVQEGPSNADMEVPKAGEAEESPAKRNEDTIIEESHPSQDTQELSQPLNIDENAIKLALSKRADELKSKASSLTVTMVRHLLEDDLGLKRDGLKEYKQFIRTLVDELLAPANEEPIVGIKTEEEAPVNTEGRPRKEEAKSSLGKKSAHGEEIEESEDNLQGNGEVSDSVSEERRPNKVQKKRKKKDTEVQTKAPVVKKSTDVKRPFSAKVERLRDVLKFVGVGVSPLVYKKAKQAPEHEREDVLIKELESRLAQEGLSPNPTEKEMKKVKTRLEKKRDLDGIEHSNIVQEPRRSRAAANSWFTPRPNKYAQAADKTSVDQDSDDDTKPVVTAAMDD